MCVKVRGGVLRIQQVRDEDAGVYICEAENTAGTAFATVTIDIESTWQLIGPRRRVPKSYSSCSCWNQFSKNP